MCARRRSRGTEGTALRKKRNNAFFSRDCRCKTRRRMCFWMQGCSFWKVEYSVEDVAQVLLSAFLSAPQGESVPGLPGMRTTQAAQQSRLADGAQALAVPVRLKQPFVTYERSSRKAALVEPTEHLKQAGQLQC